MRSLPDISVRQFEYLVSVSEHPTWSAAAEAVGVSPSALSQGLAELERRVGVALFERQGRRRVLRPIATPVVDHARQVLALTGDLVDWSDRVRSASIGSVRLGMIDVAAVVHFPEVLRSFRADHPEVATHLTVAPSKVLLDRLRDGHLDLVVCVEPPMLVPGVDHDVVMDEPLVVLAPPGASPADPASGWGPWVLFPEGSHTRTQVEFRLRERGSTVTVVADSHQPEVLVQMVRLGLGWTVLPAAQVSKVLEVESGPVLLERRLVTAVRTGAVRAPAVDSLVDGIRAAAASRERS